MERLETTHTANVGSDKEYIKQHLNYTELGLIEQCNFELDECRIKPEQYEMVSNMLSADWDQWLGEAHHE
jgi:hypothetical protein